MEIRLAKTAGFCFGVDRAVKLTYGLLDEGRKVATLGPVSYTHLDVYKRQPQNSTRSKYNTKSKYETTLYN